MGREGDGRVQRPQSSSINATPIQLPVTTLDRQDSAEDRTGPQTGGKRRDSENAGQENAGQ